VPEFSKRLTGKCNLEIESDEIRNTSITYIHEIEPPGVTIPGKAKDSTDVVSENDLDKEPTVDELRAIENLVILGDTSLFVGMIGISVPFVDVSDLARNILQSDHISDFRDGSKNRRILTLWLRLNKTKRAPTDGGMNRNLLSAKTSFHSIPVPSFFLRLSTSLSELPYKILKST
jgi:hypothetical protein